MGGLLILWVEFYFFFFPSSKSNEGAGTDTSTRGTTRETPSLPTLAPSSLLSVLALGPKVTEGKFWVTAHPTEKDVRSAPIQIILIVFILCIKKSPNRDCLNDNRNLSKKQVKFLGHAEIYLRIHLQAHTQSVALQSPDSQQPASQAQSLQLEPQLQPIANKPTNNANNFFIILFSLPF